MRLVYGGGEVPSHRRYLAGAGITDISMSYYGLMRRGVKFVKPWLVAEKFSDDVKVMLDGGAYTMNRKDVPEETLLQVSTGYESFIQLNRERVEAVIEFDALALGLEWIRQRREDFYDDLGGLFIPVWHAEWGLEELERLAATYSRVGLAQTALGDRDLVPVLNTLAERRGTRLHGLAMTKTDIMREVRWDSVGSTSWVSPMQFGDTFVWTGHEMKRYPKAYKEQARKRHRTLFTTHGFDAEKIAADDPAEVAKLSLWSWEQLLDDINSHRKPAASSPEPEPVLPVSAPEAGTGNIDRPRQLLPGINLVAPREGAQPELGVRGESLRQCNTCFLRDRGCPGFKAGANCLYELPIEVKTKEQLRAVENGMIAMQTQRVMFMRMVEDIEGGFPDPNLSNEIDRLTRMIKAQRDGTAEKFNLNISATNRPGELGALSRIFGDKVAEAQAIDAPRPVDEMIRATEMGQEVFDAEIVE